MLTSRRSRLPAATRLRAARGTRCPRWWTWPAPRPGGDDLGLEQRVEWAANALRRGGARRCARERDSSARRAVAANHEQAIVERLENVLVEDVQPVELRRLEVQLAVEAAVLDGRGHLSRHGRHSAMSSLLSGSPFSRRPSASTAIDASLRDARHEVVDAGVAPELDLLGREARRPPSDRRAAPSGPAEADANAEPARHERRRLVEAVVANRLEVAERRWPTSSQAIDDERLAHTRHQALGQAVEIEVAVEVAREADAARGDSRSDRDRTRGRSPLCTASFTGRANSTTTTVARTAMTQR